MIPESIPPTDIDERGEQLRPKWRRNPLKSLKTAMGIAPDRC